MSTRKRSYRWSWSLILLLIGVGAAYSTACRTAYSADANDAVREDIQRFQVQRGIVAVIDLPDDNPGYVVDLARASELTIYFQSAREEQVKAVREIAAEAHLLGKRIFVDHGSVRTIHLADNVADGILVSRSAQPKPTDSELLRVIRPRASAFVGDRQLVKPVPSGIDEWTHPYHGPNNNPQSNDKRLGGDLQTQFLARPKFSPMPEQTVVAGGRIFKAMGHIAHKANQNEWLNTLLCINAYNGTILWKRSLPEGFMIHRNTMVATDDSLLMADSESCKIIDAATGKVRDEITVSNTISDGPVWKWMALQDGVLYALVGNVEVFVDVEKSARRGLGHWPWSMWKGHDYKDPRTSFGFGRTLVAIDLDSKQVLWHYRDEEFLDARGVCMSGDRIFCFGPDKFLIGVDATNGQLLWRNSDEDLLSAIGSNEKAQHYLTGYATTCYIKSNEDLVFFAGPQRNKLVAASAHDGSLVWTYPHGNVQLVLRDDAIYAAGPTTTGVRLDYQTGQQIGTLPTRRACTRATGCSDSIFFRTSGGTVRVMTDENRAEHIAPMRPPCQDGVIISNGHAYWGPWMCGCQLSLYGHIALASAEHAAGGEPDAALWSSDDTTDVQTLAVGATDWPTYRGSNSRADTTRNPIPAEVELAWKVDVSNDELPTAPVVAGGMVFIADRTGCVTAFDSDGNQVWKAYTSGAIYYPPAIAHNRLFVGSADGRIHAFEAATGRALWRYRVAPHDEWIPVYGKLINRSPVAGGIVVQDQVVYGAAGIAHYDGTYVVALDALTGEVISRNDHSGILSKEVNSGISLQGNLMIVDGELRFLAGGVYETARYDLKTLECINPPKPSVTSKHHTAFYPLYPVYGKYVSLNFMRPDRTTLVVDSSYEGSEFTNLTLYSPLPLDAPREEKEAARWERRHGKFDRKPLWSDATDRRFTSFVISGDTLLTAGHLEDDEASPFLAATNVQDGTDRWFKPLPSIAVKGGTAVDGQGRIYVALENGQLACFTRL